MSTQDCCIDCNKPVRPRQEGLQCDGCEKWQHRKCNTGISQHAYREAVRIGGEIAWRCTFCNINMEIFNMEDPTPVVEYKQNEATVENLEGEQ